MLEFKSPLEQGMKISEQERKIQNIDIIGYILAISIGLMLTVAVFSTLIACLAWIADGFGFLIATPFAKFATTPVALTLSLTAAGAWLFTLFLGAMLFKACITRDEYNIKYKKSCENAKENVTNINNSLKNNKQEIDRLKQKVNLLERLLETEKQKNSDLKKLKNIEKNKIVLKPLLPQTPTKKEDVITKYNSNSPVTGVKTYNISLTPSPEKNKQGTNKKTGTVQYKTPNPGG